MKFKDMKYNARKTLKKHYLILILACALAGLIGSEFTNSFLLNSTTDVISSFKTVSPKVNKTYEEIKNTAKETTDKVSNSKSLSRKKGALSLIANSIGSDKIYLTMLNVAENITHSKSISYIIILFLNFIFYFSIWYFIINIFKVVVRRIFLEARTYEKIKIEKFIFIIKCKKWLKVSFTMFRTSVRLFLWYLTIIGGIIKTYSYSMVPFILAENPDIPSDDAIKLSITIMNGHKCESFKLHLSFIGWEILGIFTFNLSRLFYSNAYNVSTYSEYYVYLRNLAIKNKVKGYLYFNDKYLYKKASKKLLEETYSDITNKMKEKKPKLEQRVGIRGFIDKNFGITTYSNNDNILLEREQNRVRAIYNYEDIMNGKSYPDMLYSIKIKKKKDRFSNINYLKHYTITSLILIFFILSFVGWLWEVTLHLVGDGIFVNRGVLHGPILPIYGIGCIMILVFLYRFRKNPWKLFLLSIILCGVLEYSASFILEKVMNGTKWWDYTGYFLNINGRICLEGLLIFGLGGVAVVYFIIPILDNYIRKINSKYLVIISIILTCIYIIDLIYSKYYPNIGKGITDYDRLNIKIEKRLI